MRLYVIDNDDFLTDKQIENQLTAMNDFYIQEHSRVKQKLRAIDITVDNGKSLKEKEAQAGIFITYAGAIAIVLFTLAMGISIFISIIKNK